MPALTPKYRFRKKPYVCPKCGATWRQFIGSPHYVGVCYEGKEKMFEFIRNREHDDNAR